MTRGRLAAAVVAVLAVVALVVAAVFVSGWWRGTGGSYAPRGVIVHTSVSPTRSLFGQVLTATVQVVVDPRRVSTKTVAVHVDFSPFSLRDEHDTQRSIGRARELTYSYSLQCVSAKCVPRGKKGRALGGAAEFSLHPVYVTATSPTGSKVKATSAWPTFGVQSRMTADDLALDEPRIEPASSATAPVTWRVSPTLLGLLAAVIAGMALVGAAFFMASVALADGRPLRILRIPAGLTPVERALRLAEHAARRGETDESRKALERLAVELRRRGDVDEAVDAERLAWSESEPTEPRVTDLATSVRMNGAR